MMTVEEAKQELREYRENLIYIRGCQEDVEEIRELLVSATRKLSPTKTTNNSMSTDKFSDGLHRISEIEKDSLNKLEELMLKKFLVEQKINSLDQPYKNILYLRYIRGGYWGEISKKLGYEYKYTIKKHAMALKKYAELN